MGALKLDNVLLCPCYTAAVIPSVHIELRPAARETAAVLSPPRARPSAAARLLGPALALALTALPAAAAEPGAAAPLPRSGLVAAFAEAPPAAAGRTPSRLLSPLGLPEPAPLDLVFVLDTTSSMERSLPAYKKALAAVAAGAAALEPKPSLRLGLLLFRDSGDEYQASSAPLSADLAAFEAALAAARAKGGGDVPEDLGAALLAAAEGMAWRPESLRLVFLVTDAPPRPPRPGEATSYAAALRRAEELRIGVHAVGAEGIPREGEAALGEMAAATGAAYLAVGARARPPRPEAGGAARTEGPSRPAARSDPGAETRSGSTGAPPSEPNLVRGPLEELALGLVEAELASARLAAAADRRAAASRLLANAVARLAENQSYPEAARRRGAEGTVRLALSIGPSGELLGARVAQGSGSALLDRAALDLARASFPVENPARREVELEIGIRYALEARAGEAK